MPQGAWPLRLLVNGQVFCGNVERVELARQSQVNQHGEHQAGARRNADGKPAHRGERAWTCQ